MLKQITVLFLGISCSALFSQTQVGPDILGSQPYDSNGKVSLSNNGSIIAVGGGGTTVNGTYSGHARIYQYNRISGKWVQLGADINGKAAFDHSGTVSLSGDGSIVAVGSEWNDDNGNNAGQVRVFKYNVSLNNWIQIGNDINGEGADDASGSNLSISDDGTIVAIGGFLNDGNGTNAGHTRVYRYQAVLQKWLQMGSDIDGEAADDNSGYSVSLSADGKTVAIGAPYNDGGTYNGGSTRVFNYNTDSGNWIQVGKSIYASAAFDRSGFTVSISSNGKKVAIGAYGNDAYLKDAGVTRVYAFDSNSNAWVQQGSDIFGKAADESSGAMVSLSGNGNVLVLGATGSDVSANNAGQTRVYMYNSDSVKWIQLGKDINGDSAEDRGGFKLSISENGGFIATGTYYNTRNGYAAGQARIFQFCELFGITDQPEHITASIGQDTIFATESENENYQWQRDSGSGFQNLTDAGQFSGTKTNLLRVASVQSGNDNNRFRCIAFQGVCADTSNVALLSVLMPSGIGRINLVTGFTIYPNPASEYLSIMANDGLVGTAFQVFNQIGRLVKSGTLDKQNTTIDIRELAPGYYVLKTGKSGEYSGAFLVE